MKSLYDKVSRKCSQLTTKAYSTSFYLGIKCLDKSLQGPICNIYGFVRFADEIVDTFHDYDKALLLERFKKDTYQAIEEGISLNPILHSFQDTVNQFNIESELIDLFLKSMEMDLNKTQYDQNNYEKYILGSAEVVGLMCLRVFLNGDEKEYQKLRPYAMSLGSAFQKINFLRDLKADYEGMGRTYFPGLEIQEFNEESKARIMEDIEKDFEEGYQGIKMLPKNSRFGVYLAYVYYFALFRKIRKTPSSHILKTRIRVPNNKKYSLLFKTYVKHRLNLI